MLQHLDHGDHAEALGREKFAGVVTRLDRDTPAVSAPYLAMATHGSTPLHEYPAALATDRK
jgi:hypothetical protein